MNWFGLAFAFALVVFPAAAEAAQADAATDSEPTVTDVLEAAPQLLELVNRERNGAGIAPLVLREDLTAVATRWSRGMASDNRLSHNDSYFTQESIRSLGASLVGENVAMSMSLEKAHAGLMDSPPHRANILNAKYHHLGIAVVRSANGYLYVTQDFLAPAVPHSSAPRLSTRPASTRSQAPPPRPAPSASSRPADAPRQPAAPASLPTPASAPAVPAVLDASQAGGPALAPASTPLPPRADPAPVEGGAELSSSVGASRSGSLPSTGFPGWWPVLALVRRRQGSAGS